MPKIEWSFFLPAEDHRQLKSFMVFTHSRFTPWGQAILGAGIFSVGISSVGTQIAAYFVPSFVLALLITSYLLTLFFKPRIEAKRILSPTTAGGKLVYKIVVKNTGRRTIRNFSIFEQTLPYGLYPEYNHPEYRNFIDWLKPHEQATCSLVFRAPRRGVFELAPLLAGSEFPSGIIRGLRKVGAKAKFVVYPKIIVPQELVIEKGRTYQPGGILESNKVGDSNEFSSTREYRHGDRLRDIHWASTARTGRLIVKEYVEEYFVRIGFFIDEELRRFEKHRAFEARISLCAGLCQALMQRDYVLDVFLSEKPKHIQSGRGLHNLAEVLEFLAGIEGERRVGFNAAFQHLKEYGRELSQLIVFLKDWDEPRSQFVSRLKQTGLQVKPIIIRDQKTTLPVEDRSVILYTSKELGKNG